MEQTSGGTIRRFLQGWVINTLAVLVACLLPGISYDKDPKVLLFASLLLGVLNAVVRPLIMLVALPLLVFTLGLFMIVINAALLMLVDRIVSGFNVDGFWWAVLGSIIISFVSMVLNTMTGTGKSRIHVRRGSSNQRPPDRHDDGNGPIIDV